MGNILDYKGQLSRAMRMLANDTRTIFIGQGVIHKDVTYIHDTLQDVPLDRRIELPVMENTQMGLSIGLALVGFLPVTIYPRMDFLLIAADQLINHLDKFEGMSGGQFRPKVIIRTSVGSIEPLDPGPQHCQNHSEMLKLALRNIEIIELWQARDILDSYYHALHSPKSTILVEFAEQIK